MRELVVSVLVGLLAGCSVPEAERPPGQDAPGGEPTSYDWVDGGADGPAGPGAAGQPAPDGDPEGAGQPGPDAEPGPGADPDPGGLPDPEVDPDPEAEPDPEVEPDPEPDPDPAVEPDPPPVVDAGCADECELGEVDDVAGGGRQCALRDHDTGEWVGVDAAAVLADRAREYERWLLEKGTAHGGVGDAIFQDPPAYQNRTGLGGWGDSAIWTGTWLAAEALRLMATGSPAARRRVGEIVRTLHLWFNVSGDPGYLARFAAPSGEHPLVRMDCGQRGIHCRTAHAGREYDWSGHISRDQYSGVMMGYALAYEASRGGGAGLGGEETRRLIRDDVVELIRELLRERTVPVLIHWNGTPMGPVDLRTRYAIVSSHEMVDGAAEITVDTNDFGSSEIWAIREFVPNVGPLLRQIPLLGGLVPERAARPDSAVMMLAYLRMGMLVTAGEAGFEADHRAFSQHYDEHFDEWMGLAAEWQYAGECGGSYYANNIVMEPMYVLGRLEARHGDPARAARIAREILDDRMWSEHGDAKNSWFSFMHAAQSDRDRAGGLVEAVRQLEQFPPAPRASRTVDLRGDARFAEREPGCPDHLARPAAIDIADRPPQDFQWQRNPWALVHGGNPAVVYPGVDFLAAYWLGRAEGFLDDPAPERCLAWR